jgi:uncharacterized protein YndB with AHSA1/START domain
MGPVSAEIEIDVPRQRAFEAIADLSLRPAFTDHFLTDFHLTRIEPTGIGAGARFRIAVRPRRVWMDTTIVEAKAPHRLVEHGRGGRANRIPSTTLWELKEGPGALTTVHVSFWTEPSNPVDRGLELLWQARFPTNGAGARRSVASATCSRPASLASTASRSPAATPTRPVFPEPGLIGSRR